MTYKPKLGKALLNHPSASQEQHPSQGSCCGQNNIMNRRLLPQWLPCSDSGACTSHYQSLECLGLLLGKFYIPEVFAYPCEQGGSARAGPESMQAAARASPTSSLWGILDPIPKKAILISGTWVLGPSVTFLNTSRPLCLIWIR